MKSSSGSILACAPETLAFTVSAGATTPDSTNTRSATGSPLNEVPEPACVLLRTIGTLMLLRRRR